jgi:hypothetical protein
VFEEKVLKNVFGPMLGGSDRRVALRDLHFSINNPRMIKWKRMRWVGHVARMGKKRNMYKVLVGKPEIKKPVERPTRRWEHNIKVGLQVTGWEGVNYLCLAQDGNNLWSVVNTTVSPLVP